MAFEYILTLSLILNILSVVSLMIIVLSNYTKLFKTAKEEKRIIEETREKSNMTLGKAVRQANKIVAWAELRALKLISREKLDVEKITEESKKRIQSLENSLISQFQQSVKTAESSYLEFITQLEKNISSNVAKNQADMKLKTDTFAQRSKQMLDDFVNDVRNQVKTQIDAEFLKTRSEIEAYKQRRLKILNDNLIEILEKTIQIALGKKLTLSDQADLVYKALEEAKKEHALQ